MKQIHEWIPQNRLGGVGYDIGPKAAYGTWSGGTLGVLARQMDDLAEFSKAWYLDDARKDHENTWLCQHPDRGSSIAHPVHRPRVRAAEAIAQRIENKEFLSADELREALDMSASAIEAAVETGRLFVLVATDGVKYYPGFYADRTLDRTAVEAVAQETNGRPPESQYWFFTGRRTSLQATPLEAFGVGRLEDVLRAARGFVIT